MSFADKAKETALEAADQAKEAAAKVVESVKLAAAGAAEKIEAGGYVDKAAATLDEKTGGKYSEHITKVAETTKSGVSKLKADGETATSVEYSTEFGTEPTETAADAAAVFEEAERFDAADNADVGAQFKEDPLA
ncbi:MAG: antitoxin [Nocardioides sp.]|uniref:antitoxin n=1 Tax=Nocardioides sp. TaxID=35761 RepID=UPI0039E5852D